MGGGGRGKREGRKKEGVEWGGGNVNKKKSNARNPTLPVGFPPAF